ncbi:Putative transposase (fragment) [Bradyrhizobium sp. ORS 285]
MTYRSEPACSTGASQGEKSSEHLAQRNGYRERTLEPRAGAVELRISKLRKLLHGPLGAPPKAEKALTAVVQQPYVHGTSTGSVDNLVQAMGMSDTFKSLVSQLCGEIDDKSPPRESGHAPPQ